MAQLELFESQVGLEGKSQQSKSLNRIPGGPGSAPLIKVKIRLLSMPHTCERVLLLPKNISMILVHHCIQESMGWFDEHLFQFTDTHRNPSLVVGLPHEADLDAFELDSHKIKLHETFVEEMGGKPFYYTYDFGDNWVHRIFKTYQKGYSCL